MQENDWATLNAYMHNGLYECYKENLVDVNLALDVGTQEPFVQKTRDFVNKLQADGHAARLYQFDGGHVDHIGQSLEYVLAFFDECFKREKSM